MRSSLSKAEEDFSWSKGAISIWIWDSADFFLINFLKINFFILIGTKMNIFYDKNYYSKDRHHKPLDT